MNQTSLLILDTPKFGKPVRSHLEEVLFFTSIWFYYEHYYGPNTMNSDFYGAKLIKTEYASATLVAGYGKRLGLALDRPDNVVQLNDKNIDYYRNCRNLYERIVGR